VVLQNEHPTRVVKACQFHHVPKTTINSSFQSSNLSTIKILNVTSYWTKRVLNSFYFPHRKIEINTIEERGRDYIYRDIERGLEEWRENGWWRWRREQFGIHSHLGCCCCLFCDCCCFVCCWKVSSLWREVSQEEESEATLWSPGKNQRRYFFLSFLYIFFY